MEEWKQRLQALFAKAIHSVKDLEVWLVEERELCAEIEEAITKHFITFYKDTKHEKNRQLHIEYQREIQPLLTSYEAKFDEKFSDCPFTLLLDEKKYGHMRNVRLGRKKLFQEKNIALVVREQELITQYREIMASMTIDWDGETKSRSYIKAKLDSPNRDVRKRAWQALAEENRRVKKEVDGLMTELIEIRHQMACNAGFMNYRDYIFVTKHREYRVEDCYMLHASVETYVIPVWRKVAHFFKTVLQVETYRPWDRGSCTMQQPAFDEFADLVDGVGEMLRQTDSYFHERFQYMRKQGLLDVEARANKGAGAICFTLPKVREVFIHMNFSPSFDAVNALVHEMGHAIHFYKQFENESSMQERYLREEVAELYSHSLELFVMDKLNVFYQNPIECKWAQREQLRRACSLLISPVAGDLFQHWMYTNPHHTSEERDAKYLEISKRFQLAPVDIVGIEEEVSTSWIEFGHYIQYPFYNIEYAISQLGALQLFQLYRENPEKAISFFKEGASIDWNTSIVDIYRHTGVSFDFSHETVKRIADCCLNYLQD
ncbi:M3 family oligoendopeptidase [Priestia taiwanensis]|uniref:M3 family oligoendopeptidase n=1 Tax=Priestia taiwanensis TaxID=1347902 RepID=A0A917AM15_9BACI|nr:M3 family oligoendopeptidase [Priestia taiwanensis]MBM7361912.1 M3 family oligoendopeptidase [Priestia taiwanensis]GGE57948.1 M3 family oligoendopeptidase [Priestia taiwanensis]